jgi:hypothetical protein
VTSATKKKPAHANGSVALLTGEAHATVVKETRNYRHSGIAAALSSSPSQNRASGSQSNTQGARRTCCSNAAQFRRVPSTADAKISKPDAAEAALANSAPATSRNSDIFGMAARTPWRTLTFGRRRGGGGGQVLAVTPIVKYSSPTFSYIFLKKPPKKKQQRRHEQELLLLRQRQRGGARHSGAPMLRRYAATSALLRSMA